MARDSLLFPVICLSFSTDVPILRAFRAHFLHLAPPLTGIYRDAPPSITDLSPFETLAALAPQGEDAACCSSRHCLFQIVVHLVEEAGGGEPLLVGTDEER